MKTILAILLACLMASCGPVKAPPKRHFFLIFHNQSHFDQDVTVRTAVNGVYVGGPGIQAKVIAGTDCSFELGEVAPDLVDVQAGWGRLAWSGPDLSGTSELNVNFPDGSSWKGYP